MAARPVMDERLFKIQDRIAEMAGLVDNAIGDTVTALMNNDKDLARNVIDNGDEVDELEDKISKDCFYVLSTQAPIAGDLRFCIAVLRLIRDLERIGDHAENLAKYVLRFEDTQFFVESKDLERMAKMAKKMVSMSTKAFLDQDLRLAIKVWKSDEDVDEIYRNIFAKEINEVTLIGSHLERIADYSTNICEDIMFYVEGTSTME
ncbi:MAG: phosphate signaling complex protein PhoU [Anaerovoracaceae bacterium]